MKLGEHTTFEFIRDFSSFEHDLKRSGFLTSRKGYPEADWNKYAECMGGRFDNIGDQCLKDSIEYLTDDPPNKLIVQDGSLRWNNMGWNDKDSRAKKVLGAVRVVRNNLFHGEKPITLLGGSDGIPDRDKKLLKAGITVLHYCKEILENEKNVEQTRS